MTLRRFRHVMVLVLAVLAAAASWLWVVGMTGAVSFGAPLRPEWKSWLILLFYGFVPAVIATGCAIIALRRWSEERTAPAEVIALISPTALLVAVFAPQFGMWPL